jgi:hypothetical protein
MMLISEDSVSVRPYYNESRRRQRGFAVGLRLGVMGKR